jgi:hypothetical protein
LRDQRVWLDQWQFIVSRVDACGLVLEQRRRGLSPLRRLLNPAELAAVLESGRLRPAGQIPEKGLTP